MHRKSSAAFLLLLAEKNRMRYHPLPASFYQKTRKNFMAQMKGNSLAVFNSNDIYPISADSTLPFEQHRDIFYLTGVDQEESILVLYPSAVETKHREIFSFAKQMNISPFGRGLN